MKYGHFSSDRSEFIVTRPDTPRAFDNMLWNDACYSIVQQTGVGCFDYQVGDKEAIQLFTGIGRVCDFDVFGREHLMNRLIYIRDNENGQFWTVNWEPVRVPYTSYTCTHGAGYTIICNVTNGVEATLRLFVPVGSDPVEMWTLSLRDVDGKARDLSVFTYCQMQFMFKWGFDSYGDMIYRTVEWDQAQNAVVATKHPYVKPHNYLTAFLTSDQPIAAFDGTRDAFVGTYTSLSCPDAVVEGSCHNIPGSADATVAALQWNIALAAGETYKVDVLLGATDDAAKVTQIKNRFLGKFDCYFEDLKAHKRTQLTKSLVDTPDDQYNCLYNTWLKQATLYSSHWCRWGYNGYRDIVQHALGIVTIEPERTRQILINALQYQYASGMAVRGWNPVDNRPYSDSAMWLSLTLVAYLRETGDFEFLKEEVSFYDEGKATVLAHIEAALDFLEANKGERDLLLIKFGDWNDSLTGIGKEGKGESVWLSIAYAEALRQMADVFAFLGNAEKATEYMRRRENMVRALGENAWDGEWYLRGIADSGRAIGSHTEKQAKLFFEPQCWSLIAGIHDEARTQVLLNACKRELGSPFGYLFLSPVFTEFDPEIGRISSMEPGIAENGTVYSHLNIWMIQGLLRSGRAEEAYQLFKAVSPGYITKGNESKESSPPYMYANCYFGPTHKNRAFQMEFTWITGSTAWFTNVLLNEMMGAKATLAGLEIDPRLPAEWKECKVKRSFRGCEYQIAYHNPNGVENATVKQITVDGKLLDTTLLPLFTDGVPHQVEVLLG